MTNSEIEPLSPPPRPDDARDRACTDAGRSPQAFDASRTTLLDLSVEVRLMIWRPLLSGHHIRLLGAGNSIRHEKPRTGTGTPRRVLAALLGFSKICRTLRPEVMGVIYSHNAIELVDCAPRFLAVVPRAQRAYVTNLSLSFLYRCRLPLEWDAVVQWVKSLDTLCCVRFRILHSGLCTCGGERWRQVRGELLEDLKGIRVPGATTWGNAERNAVELVFRSEEAAESVVSMLGGEEAMRQIPLKLRRLDEEED